MARINPAEWRKSKTVEVELPGGTVLCRKDDLTQLVLDGKVPMPMLQAVQKMVAMPNATAMQRVQALDGYGQDLTETLRDHAVRVAIDPPIARGVVEGALQVELMDLKELMVIWVNTAIVPPMGAAASATFREPAGADPAPVASPGDDVRAAAEQLGDRSVEPERVVHQ